MDLYKNPREAGERLIMGKELTIYYTSDTHGHIFPVDYASGGPEATEDKRAPPAGETGGRGGKLWLRGGAYMAAGT